MSNLPRTSIDPAVVEAARRGEEAGLRRLVTESYPLIRRWMTLHGSDPAEVDDVTQDVMITVLRRLPSFRGECRFTTWLYRVSRNAWLDRRKARSRRDRAVLPLEHREIGAEAALPASSENPARAIEIEDLRERLLRAFEALTARQREVFDLADVQGFTSPEIAEMLGVEPSSVRVTLLKARRALRVRLLQLDPDLAREYGDEL